MTGYIYRGEPEQRVFGPLPEGDYSYVVAECGEPYQKDNNNWVLRVKLAIQPSGVPVFASPWSGTDRNGEERDGIADFLLSCDRAPSVGSEPDWERVVGAKGRCRLKIEIAQMGALAGKEINRVDRFYRPKQVGPGAEQPPRTSYNPDEVAKAQAEQRRRSGDDDMAPDDLPF